MTKHVSLEDLLNDQDDQAKEMEQWLNNKQSNIFKFVPIVYGPPVELEKPQDNPMPLAYGPSVDSPYYKEDKDTWVNDGVTIVYGPPIKKK